MYTLNLFWIISAIAFLFVVVMIKLLFAKSQTKIDWSGHLDKLMTAWTSREFQGFAFLSALVLYAVINRMPELGYFMNIWLIAFGVFTGSRTILKYTEAKNNA